MLKCSYVVLIFNNEDIIPKLINSLQKISGDFRREFIFVDDGSTDNSLKILKQSTAILSKTTIIAHQNLGPSLSFNKAINLIDGDYVHFVQGSEILQPESTMKLINCCETMKVEVAIGISSRVGLTKTSGKILIKPSPIKEILEYTVPNLRDVGLPGSLVKLSLLNQINGADEMVYNCSMSLSLRCAKYSQFAFIDEIISISEDIAKSEAQLLFEAYNNLQATVNFIQSNLEFCEDYKSSLLLALYQELKIKQVKYQYYLQYILSKLFNNISLHQIIRRYEQELAKLL